jgi:hypothetical protein
MEQPLVQQLPPLDGADDGLESALSTAVLSGQPYASKGSSNCTLPFCWQKLPLD